MWKISLGDALVDGHLRRSGMRRADDEIAIGIGRRQVPSGSSLAVTNPGAVGVARGADSAAQTPAIRTITNAMVRYF